MRPAIMHNSGLFRSDISDATSFGNLAGILVDCGLESITALLLACDGLLFSLLLRMHLFHFLCVRSLEVIQVQFLARTMQLVLSELFLFEHLLLLKLGLSFLFQSFHLGVSVLYFLLISSIREDWRLLLNHLLTLSIDLRFEAWLWISYALRVA